jgi:hypothetical protein
MPKKLGDKRKNEKVTPADWNIFIATPAYDGKVDTDYALSMSEASFCSPLFQVKLTASIMGNGAFIDLARNLFVKQFLEDFKECTHLFFIDSDLKFPANAFIGLARSGLPICAGVYRRRQREEDYPVSWEEHPTEGGFWVENDFLMCSRVPTGFLCISRDVLQKMSDAAEKIKVKAQTGEDKRNVARLFYTKIDDDGNFVGEDYCFCDDYKKIFGKPIPVWPDIDFVHAGYRGNLQTYLERKIKEQAEAA